MGTFTDKRVLVTGGSKGIGEDIARQFAARGATVVISSRTQKTLDKVAASITAEGGTAHPIACDVTDRAQVDALAQQIEDRIGGIDILVNNAGVAGSHKFRDHPDDLWHHIQNVNVNSVYYVSQAIVPGMMDRGWGRVINMASIASKAAPMYMTAYVTSKHALLGLTRAMATELNRYGITVNAICPGYVDTPMTQGALAIIQHTTGRSEDEARASLEGFSPQQRLMEPQEITHVALMLAGDDARGITGQAINVDGGAVMF